MALWLFQRERLLGSSSLWVLRFRNWMVGLSALLVGSEGERGVTYMGGEVAKQCEIWLYSPSNPDNAL